MKLSSLTPAETLMLLRPNNVSGKELLKYTFLNLIFNNILIIYKDWRKSNPRDKHARLHTFISRGTSFEQYQSLEHQDIFAYPFKRKNLEFKLRFLLRKVYKQLGKKTPKFKSDYVYQDLKNKGYFKLSIGFGSYYYYFLNNKGKKASKELKKQLDKIENDLPKFLNEDHSKAKELIHQLGSNILLLKCFNDDLINKIKTSFEGLSETTKISKSSILNYDDLNGIFLYSFIDLMDSLEFSFDILDQSFDYSFSFSDSDFSAGDLVFDSFGDF